MGSRVEMHAIKDNLCQELEKDRSKYATSVQALVEAYQALKTENQALICQTEALKTGNEDLRAQAQAHQAHIANLREDLEALPSLEARNRDLETKNLEAEEIAGRWRISITTNKALFEKHEVKIAENEKLQKDLCDVRKAYKEFKAFLVEQGSKA